MDKWLIEELYSSGDCRHKNSGGYCKLMGVKFTPNELSGSIGGIKCNKENCTLRVKKGE